jgi:outer membrane protein
MTRKTLSIRTLVALGLAAAAAVGGCGLKDPPPFDPIAMQRGFRERARENATPALAPLPLTLDKTFLVKRDGSDPNVAKPPALPTTAQAVGPVIRMSLRDLVQLAAANSLQVRVANYQPAVDQARVIEAEARFDPTFFTNVNFANQSVLVGSPSNVGGSNSAFQTSTLATGFKQDLPNGAQVQLQYQLQHVLRANLGPGNRADFGNDVSIGQPGQDNGIFESSMQLQITQPLLRNFGAEVNQARITVARNTQRVSILDARLQLEKTLSEIEEIYWQLVQAERELAIQEELYNQTVSTSVLLQQRAGQDVTLVQLTQSNAALQSRNLSLVDARNRLRLLSHELKRRINDPNMPVASSTVILPDDRPVETPIKFDLAEQIESALMNRAELAQQQIRIDSASVVYKAAQNNVLPQLNLVGSIGYKSVDPAPGVAIASDFENSREEFSIGLQLEVPLGNREPRAILRRTGLQRMQAITQYKDLIEQVTQEVRTAHDNLYTAWERLGSARQNLYAAQASLDAIQQEQDVGNAPLTPEFVNRKLNAQEVLAQARREDARAATDYNTAISALERAKGTLLKYDNVIMAEEPLVAGGVRVSRKTD